MEKLRNERLSNWPQVTQLVRGEVGMQTQAVWLQDLCFLLKHLLVWVGIFEGIDYVSLEGEL